MRSKTLLVSNILSTIYAAVLLYIFGGGIVAAGGMDYIAYCRQYFSLAYELLGFSSLSMNVVYAIVILLLIHIVTFTLGVLFGWIGYSAKKKRFSKICSYALSYRNNMLSNLHFLWTSSYHYRICRRRKAKEN